MAHGTLLRRRRRRGDTRGQRSPRDCHKTGLRSWHRAPFATRLSPSLPLFFKSLLLLVACVRIVCSIVVRLLLPCVSVYHVLSSSLLRGTFLLLFGLPPLCCCVCRGYSRRRRDSQSRERIVWCGGRERGDGMGNVGGGNASRHSDSNLSSSPSGRKQKTICRSQTLPGMRAKGVVICYRVFKD